MMIEEKADGERRHIVANIRAGLQRLVAGKLCDAPYCSARATRLDGAPGDLQFYCRTHGEDRSTDRRIARQRQLRARLRGR
jgi:hypothetical protein